ncbi:MAG: hypothetical protein ACE14V_13675 [bacterium]
MFRTAESIAGFRGFAIQPLSPEGDRFTQRDASGRFYGHYGLGQSLLAVPLVWLGNLISPIIPLEWNAVFRMPNIPLQANFSRFIVSRFNQCITAITCLLLFQLGIILGYHKKSVMLVTLIYGLATIAMPHAKTFFSEPVTTLLILFAFYSLLQYKHTGHISWIIWSGISIGYAILTRIDSIIILPIFFIYLVFIIVPRQSKIKTLASWLIPIVIFGGLVALYNYVRFGAVTSTGYESEGLTFSYPILDGLYGLLMSSGRSILLFSPPVILFFFAIKTFWDERRQEAYFCSALILVYILFYAKWESWAGGWSWGPRHIFQVHSFMLIPLFALFDKYIKKPKSIFWISIVLITAIGLFVQITGILVSFMVYHQWLFTQVPELWYSLYIPAHSSLVGYWQIIRLGVIDLFMVNLWQSQLPVWVKCLPVIPFLIMVVTGYYIFKKIGEPDIPSIS